MNPASIYTSNLIMISKFLHQDFAPDGDLDKKFWKDAEWVPLGSDLSGAPCCPESETRVASLWTVEYIYFAFRCKYTELTIYEGENAAEERWGLWNRDVVEVFINPQPERASHYYELEVAPNNQWIDLEIDKTKTPFNDPTWNSGFEHATHIVPKNNVWICEIRIPVKSMGVQGMQPNLEWRLNLFRIDGPDDDSQRRFMSWSSIREGKSFHVPERFGIIRFVR